MYSGGKSFDGDYPLLSTAIEGGLFHPRCKDSTSTYYEGITTLKPVSKEEMAEMDRREKLEEQQLYYKNQAKKNKRIADNSLDKDNQRIYKFRADENAKKADEIGEKLTKSVANSSESGIIRSRNYAKISDLLNYDAVPEGAQITPQALIDDLMSSDTGRNILAYIENLPERPILDYLSEPEKIRAEEVCGKSLYI